MDWYYVEAQQQVGPVDEAQLQALAASGKILNDTLVWREGMENWQMYGVTTVPASTGAVPPPVIVAAGPPLGPGQAVCAECGGVFNLQDTIPYGGIHVCAGCKPVFMQKLTEGAGISTGQLSYAGFWIRFGAKFIDGIILRVVGMPLGFLIGLAAPGQSPSHLIVVELLAGGVGMVIAIAYSVFFVGKYGATPGKMACRIKVVMADGTPVSYGRAFGRFWAEILSGCPTLCIGYIMAGSDIEKRALHDRICSTRVVRKQP